MAWLLRNPDFAVVKTMLNHLLRAQDNLARLEAATAAAAGPVREGLLARVACQEGAGWLAHQGRWIHPLDLAMRAAGITGSVAAAGLGTRLASVLPSTLAASSGQEDGPEDRDVTTAIRQCVLFERLATLRSWQPDDAPLAPGDEPALLAAARMIVAPGGPRLTAAAVLRAAAVWRDHGGSGMPGLVLWSAPVALLHRAAMAAEALPVVVEAIAEAAGRARRELVRLQAAEGRLRGMAATRRSHLPAAAALVLRRPVVTAGQMAAALGITSRGAALLLDRMVAAGVLREATGRRSWRGFVVI